MTADYQEFRDQFLAACAGAALETQELSTTIQVAEQNRPEIFAEHVHASYLDKQAHLWSDGFFQECLSEASEIFSLSRLEHLLAVRESLRATGVSGFKPTIQKKQGARTHHEHTI